MLDNLDMSVSYTYIKPVILQNIKLSSQGNSANGVDGSTESEHQPCRIGPSAKQLWGYIHAVLTALDFSTVN